MKKGELAIEYIILLVIIIAVVVILLIASGYLSKVTQGVLDLL